ncbi:MAG: ROK family protein [Acidimicrobiia bacterium]
MSVLGIDIGGTKSYAVRMQGSEAGAHLRIEHGNNTDMIDAVIDTIDQIADGTEEAIGVGVTGLVSISDRSVAWGPHLSGTNVPVGDILEERFGLPVAVDNDAHMALIAEVQIGAAVGYENVLLVTLGTGIGGAIAIGGSVYRGAGFAGEWGHMTVDTGGLLCDCGRRGCWETLASGPALERLAREVIAANPTSSLGRAIGDNPITGHAVVGAADGGDETARALVAEIGAAFGRGLADLTAIFDPDIIVVGGGLGSVGEAIIGPARRTLTDSLHGGAYRVPPAIQVAQLGPAAGAIGAAIRAQEEVRSA